MLHVAVSLVYMSCTHEVGFSVVFTVHHYAKLSISSCSDSFSCLWCSYVVIQGVTMCITSAHMSVVKPFSLAALTLAVVCL